MTILISERECLIHVIAIDIRSIDERGQFVHLKPMTSFARFARSRSDKVYTGLAHPRKERVTTRDLYLEAVRMGGVGTTLDATSAKLGHRRKRYVMIQELSELHQQMTEVGPNVFLRVNRLGKNSSVWQRLTGTGPSRRRDTYLNDQQLENSI